jgi:uncharacterized protein (DUF1778 family)
MAAEQTRLNVNLRADDYTAVKQLAETVGQDLSEFVRNALRLYVQVIDEAQNGQRFYIGTEKQKREVLIRPTISNTNTLSRCRDSPDKAEKQDEGNMSRNHVLNT